MELKDIQNLAAWEWPKNTADTLLKVLRENNGDDADRLVAVEMAGDMVVINDDLVDVLLSILKNKDEPEMLRGAAATSLGPILEYADLEDFEDPDDEPISEDTFNKINLSLRKLYMDADMPKLVRRRILEASVRSPQDWHKEAVRVAFADNDKEWCLTAVFAMQFYPGFDKEILAALDSEHSEVHYWAVCAAGARGVDDAWPHVIALLESTTTEKDLMLAAIEAAAEIRPADAGMYLVDLTGHADEEIAEAAEEAMVMATADAEWEEFDDEADFDDFDDEEEGDIVSE